MHQHALRTAATLYREGTWTLETAANHAGVTPEHFEQTVERYGLAVAEHATETAEKVRVAAD